MTIEYKTGRFYDFEQVLEIEEHPIGFTFTDKSRGMTNPMLVRANKKYYSRMSDTSVGRVVLRAYDAGEYCDPRYPIPDGF